MRLVLDLVDLFKIVLQAVRCEGCVHVAGGLSHDLLDHVELDHLADVGVVVGALEHLGLGAVLEVQVLEELEPDLFELVGVVFEKFEVVTDRRKDLVEFCCEIFVIFRDQLL